MFKIFLIKIWILMFGSLHCYWKIGRYGRYDEYIYFWVSYLNLVISALSIRIQYIVFYLVYNILIIIIFILVLLNILLLYGIEDISILKFYYFDMCRVSSQLIGQFGIKKICENFAYAISTSLYYGILYFLTYFTIFLFKFSAMIVFI